LTIRLLLQPPVSGVAVSLLVSGLTADILITFCGVLMVQCVKLMLRIFKFVFILFATVCLSPKCNMIETFLPGMGITQVQEDIIIVRLAVFS